jgi:putative intracellular protease/amidase
MEPTQRRDFLAFLATAAGLAGSAQAQTPADPHGGHHQGSSGQAATPPAAAASKPVHDMGAFPPQWMGKEKIAMLLYPNFTALDLVGPQYMLINLWGAKVHLVARTLEPVRSDTGITITPTMTLDQCPKDLDVLFVPGGSQGTLEAMRDESLVRWLAEQGKRSKLVASVCTGSMLLGQAGLLRGKRATSHWVTHPLLGQFGATAVNQRVVWDGNLVTGAGVSAGLDLGLEIVAKLRDPLYAQCVQLLAEYAPKPPYNAGTPATAPLEATLMMGGMFEQLLVQMKETSASALGARG